MVIIGEIKPGNFLLHSGKQVTVLEVDDKEIIYTKEKLRNGRDSGRADSFDGIKLKEEWLNKLQFVKQELNEAAIRLEVRKEDMPWTRNSIVIQESGGKFYQVFADKHHIEDKDIIKYVHQLQNLL